MTIEAKYGVPTVAMHTDKFDKVVRSVATVNGMPGLRQVFVPQPIMGKRSTHFREYWEYTVEKVAVNAVMAGARPAYFPVILALAATGVTARSSSSSASASMAVVNGPIRHEIGMNAGIGAMGPYNHANATIGRAFGLLSGNLQGGSEPGHTYMGSQGNGYAYGSLTFAENEERSPWEPFHVQYG